MPARGEGGGRERRGVKGLWWNEADDCWHYDFRVSGHRFRGSCRTKARREAERHVQELRRQAAATLRESAGVEPMSFETASSRWWLEKGQHRARPHEIERDLAWLQTAIGARTLIRSIDSNEVSRLISLRRAEGVSASTVNRTVTEHLRAIHRRAGLWGQPVKPIDWKELMLAEPAARPREASAEEEAALLDATREDYRPVMRFALLSGLRLEELVSMQRRHIHFGERRLYLTGKGGKMAFIPLTDAMIRILREELARHRLEAVWSYAPARRAAGRVVSLKRAPITYQGLKTQFRRARARAGLDSTGVDPLMGFRLHDMRHTALTRVTRAGGILMAQKLGRHADLKTTMRYVHAEDDDLRKAMAAAETSHGSSHAEAEKPQKSSKLQRLG